MRSQPRAPPVAEEAVVPYLEDLAANAPEMPAATPLLVEE